MLKGVKNKIKYILAPPFKKVEMNYKFLVKMKKVKKKKIEKSISEKKKR